MEEIKFNSTMETRAEIYKQALDLTTEEEFKDMKDVICWKAAMFDEINAGIYVYDRTDGKLIGIFRTQLACANELGLTPYQVSRYLARLSESKKYIFKYDDFYTYLEFKEWCEKYGREAKEKRSEEKGKISLD